MCVCVHSSAVSVKIMWHNQIPPHLHVSPPSLPLQRRLFFFLTKSFELNVWNGAQSLCYQLWLVRGPLRYLSPLLIAPALRLDEPTDLQRSAPLPTITCEYQPEQQPAQRRILSGHRWQRVSNEKGPGLGLIPAYKNISVSMKLI